MNMYGSGLTVEGKGKQSARNLHCQLHQAGWKVLRALTGTGQLTTKAGIS
jgi:Holliday junction resolvase